MMKKVLILVVFAGFLAMGTYAQNNATRKAPKIVFEEKSIDFGSIKEGEHPEIVFKFYNAGTAPLVLKNVRPSCGCTVPKWPREPIMPGDSGQIVATFNSLGFGGRSVHKSVTVTTNVPQPNGNDQVVVLFFKGFVQPKNKPNNASPQVH